MPSEGPLDHFRLVLSPDVNLPALQKLVLAVLIRHYNTDRGCFPSLDRIAACAGIHKTAVIRALKGLEAAGVVGITNSKGRSNRYALNLANLPRKSGRVEQPVAESDQLPKATSTSGGEQPDQSLRATLTNEVTAKGTINTYTPKNQPDVKWFFDDWNELATEIGLDQCKRITDKRRKKARVCLKQYGRDGLTNALSAIQRSRYLRGEVNGWQVTIGWLLNTDNMLKVLEGNYVDRKPHNARQSTRTPNRSYNHRMDGTDHV